MLLKPPSIFEDVVSQDSEHHTTNSKNKSIKNRQGKKQTTLRVAPSFEPSEKVRDYDNQSIHSANSKRSKQKKSKQTTLARPPILSPGNLHREDDTHSNRSNGSKHSNKSHKKQSNIMQRPKMQNLYRPAKLQRQFSSQQNQEESQIQPSFKAAILDMEQSIVKLEDREKSPKPLRYIENKKQKQLGGRGQGGVKYRPFANIMGESQEEIPVFKIEDKARVNQKNQVLGVNKYQNNQEKRSQEKKTASQKPIQKKKQIEQSKSVFENSRMNTTKNPRKPIFSRQKDQLNNTSKVTSNLGQSNLTNIDDSRRKSSSRLRQIFNNSRSKQKNSLQGSIQNYSKYNPSEIMASQITKSIKPTINDKIIPLQKKVLDSDNDNFNLQSSKSGLDLTLSQNGPIDKIDRDSLVFQFQPQRRSSKGMTVVSGKRSSKQSKQMIQLKNDNLISIQRDKPKDELPILQNNNLVSKDMRQIQKILKQNQDYLKNSALNLSSSYRPKPRKLNQSQELFNIDQQQPIECIEFKNQILQSKPWHEVVSDFHEERGKNQPVVNIKSVERNEKITNKRKQQININSRQDEVKRQKEVDERKIKEQELLMRQKKMKEEKQKQRERQKERQKLKKMNEQKLRRSNQQRQRQLKIQQQQQQRAIKQQQQRLKRIEQQQRRKLQERISLQKQKQKQKTKRRQVQKQLQKQNKQRQQRLKIKEQEDRHILNHLTSQISQELPDNRSEKSNKSSKKKKNKKQSSIARDKHHKVFVKSQTPRNQQSFYESSQEEPKNVKQQKKQINDLSLVSKNQANIVKEDKKPNLYNFQDDNQEEYVKPKSKTDMNFYDQSIKSIKPPSSKPPLSGRSGRSQSSSKQKVLKQNTIQIKNKNDHKNMLKKQTQQNKPKKMTLMQKAMIKHNQSQDDSQQSFNSSRSREEKFSSNSRNSARSNNSRNSKKSVKENAIKINQRENSFVNLGKPPNHKKISSNSSHEQQMQHAQRNSKDSSDKYTNKMQYIQPRTIVSKNCTYIDQNGKLVHKDLVIKGSKVYGVSRMQDFNVSAMQRMKRTKESHRSRSRSKSRSRQNNNLLKRKSSKESSQYQSSSSNYYESNYYDSLYQNSQYNQQKGYNTEYQSKNNNRNDSAALRQFIKPVAEVPNYNKINKQEKTGPGFYNNNNNRSSNTQQVNGNSIYTMNLGDSRSKKTLKRTEKSNSKRC